MITRPALLILATQHLVVNTRSFPATTVTLARTTLVGTAQVAPTPQLFATITTSVQPTRAAPPWAANTPILLPVATTTTSAQPTAATGAQVASTGL
jgi:hypothetical protein